jgi:hypothetical protein
MAAGPMVHPTVHSSMYGSASTEPQMAYLWRYPQSGTSLVYGVCMTGESHEIKTVVHGRNTRRSQLPGGLATPLFWPIVFWYLPLPYFTLKFCWWWLSMHCKEKKKRGTRLIVPLFFSFPIHDMRLNILPKLIKNCSSNLTPLLVEITSHQYHID